MPDKEYLLHFAGSGLYNKSRFINEARRIGVQRACAWPALQKIVWGQTILVAEYRKKPAQICDQCKGEGGFPNFEDHKLESTEVCDKCDGKKITAPETPIAEIYGYFHVSELSYQLPPDVLQALEKKLDVVDIQMGGSGMAETRACGSYVTGPCTVVRDSIESIVKKIGEAARECGKNPLRFKYFLKGQFKVLPSPIVLEPCSFQRGYKKVSVPLDIEGEEPRKAVFTLYDYSRKKYMKKEERDAADKVMMDEYVADTGRG